MTYAALNLVYNWCVEQFVANSNKNGEATASVEYLEALEELAYALKKVMKFN